MSSGPPWDAPLSAVVTICNKRGLHARASAKFVQRAESFNATVKVEREGTEVAGTSIMGLMMLAAAMGTEIRISATGPEAAEAMAALVALVEARFHEDS